MFKIKMPYLLITFIKTDSLKQTVMVKTMVIMCLFLSFREPMGGDEGGGLQPGVSGYL